MAEEFDDDQFDGYVSTNTKNRYDYFNDIQPEQEQTQIQNAPIFAVTQIPLYTSPTTQPIPDISSLYQNQPLNQQSHFNSNPLLQSNFTNQNDNQHSPIYQIPQQNNPTQLESFNSNGHSNYAHQQQQQQQSQAYEDEEFQEGEFIEVQKPIQIKQESLLADQPQILSTNKNEEHQYYANIEQQEQLINFEIPTSGNVISPQQQQQIISTIQQEPKIQLTSIYDAFPSELNETPTSLQPSPLLQITDLKQETQNDSKYMNNVNLIEMYQNSVIPPINDQHVNQMDESSTPQQKQDLLHLIDFNKESNPNLREQHYEQQSDSLLQFSNEKQEQQQPIQQEPLLMQNNLLSLHNDLPNDAFQSEQQHQQISSYNFQNIVINRNFETEDLQEESKTPIQELQHVQFKPDQMAVQSTQLETKIDNEEFDEFVEGEEIESTIENHQQTQQIQMESTITNQQQQQQVVQNPQITSQIYNIQEHFHSPSSQQQIQFQESSLLQLNNIQLTPEIKIKQGPLKVEPIQKRNWRNQIEDIVGFDAECMDSFIEELSDLKLNLYKAQVLEYAQLAKDIQALRKKKQIHVDKEEYEEATVIRDTLRAKEPIAMVLKKKILQIAKVIDQMDQQDLDYHIKKYIFDHESEIPENPSIEMLLPKIQIVEDFVSKLKKELKKSESVLSIIKLQGQLEKVRYEKKYQNFILGLRKIIGMSHRFSQLNEIVQSVNDRLSDLKIEKEVNKLDYEFIFENTLIPYLKGQQQQQNYCNYCFQSKSDLIEYKGKLYDVCCLNFYYNIN
ncbi:unnamed protein product (macronuclear) [Paramecium tetraurelia]|uniref:UVR domain-containing protein n=1 Tax=Paramecium tetraurelia TaxID=5888 RepID=A0DIQ8_PARTE|nr:uncharacterized protein GSPATT00017282001 [Paramecium tetraurelia]CAK82925.1 unnamed protein product [Paramecium tetraurelia]|eukprot:XP_001450322.1 hypothetical protein (macronuclear) [Paramecium tetraurelia strain d4-2]